MVVEFLALAALASGGIGVMHLAGLRGWLLAPLGILTGAGLQVGLVAVLLLAGAPTRAAVVLPLVAAPILVAALLAARSRDHAGDFARVWAGTVVGIAALVAVLRTETLFRFHVDSFTYLNIGLLLESDHWSEAASPYLHSNRQIGVAALHSAANVTNDVYLRALTPLLSLAALAVLWWAVRALGRLPDRASVVLAWTSVAAVALTNRWVFHAFYLNGHLVSGAWLLVIVVAVLALARRAPMAGALAVAASVAGVGVGFSRGEGFLLVALAVMPLALHSAVRTRDVVIVVAGPAVTGLAWNGLGPLVFGLDYSMVVLGQVAICTGMLATVGISRMSTIRRRGRRFLFVAELLVWSVLAVNVVREPGMAWESAVATVLNAASGYWGVSLALLLVAVAACAVLVDSEHVWVARPLATLFVPVAFLLVYLRDGTYRVGHFDSLNRMWVEWFLVAVFFVAASAADGSWRLRRGPWRWRSRESAATVDNRA